DAAAERSHDRSAPGRPFDVPRRNRNQPSAVFHRGRKQTAGRSSPIAIAEMFPPREQPRRFTKRHSLGQVFPRLGERLQFGECAQRAQAIATHAEVSVITVRKQSYERRYFRADVIIATVVPTQRSWAFRTV